MKKKVLLTGASGFVGQNFLRLYSNEFEISPRSLRDQNPLEINMVGVDCIVHCAALVHQMKGAPESAYFEINYELTKKLAQKAVLDGVRHFVFISTAHVFGDSGNLENHRLRLSPLSACHPADAYGRSKLKAEEFLLSLQSAHFCVSILRPPMIYGKGAKGNILNLARMIRFSPLLPLGYRFNHRSLIGIENFCYFISLAVDKKISGIFLPQDERPLSIAEIVTTLAQAMNKRLCLFSLPPFFMKRLFKLAPKVCRRLFGTLAMDSEASNQALGYTPRLSTYEGFKSMLS